jgi:hypothetical protein
VAQATASKGKATMTAPTRNETAQNFLADLSHEVIQLAKVQTVRDLVLLQLEGMKQSGRIVSYKPPTIDRKYLEVIVTIPFATYQAKAPWWAMREELERSSTEHVVVQAYADADSQN